MLLGVQGFGGLVLFCGVGWVVRRLVLWVGVGCGAAFVCVVGVCAEGFGVENSLGFLPAVFSTVRLRIRAATFDPAPCRGVFGRGGTSPSDGRTTRAGRRQLWLAGVWMLAGGRGVLLAACLMLVLRLLVIRLFPGRVVGLRHRVVSPAGLGLPMLGRFIRRLMRRAGGFLMIGTLRFGVWMRVLRRRLRVGFVSRGSTGPRRVGMRVISVRQVICGRAWWIGGSVTTFRRRVFLLAAG